MTLTAPPLAFVSRARRDPNATAERRVWISVCGRFRVVYSKSLYERDGRGRRRQEVRAEWQVRTPCGWTWEVIRKYRPAGRDRAAIQEAIDRAKASCRRAAKSREFVTTRV